MARTRYSSDAEEQAARARIKQLLSNYEYVDWWNDTPYVACDEICFALQEPETLEECKAALKHWRYHSYLHGCSYGA